MTWKIEVAPKHRVSDATGAKLRNDILSLGIKGVDRVRVARLYFLEGAIDNSAVEQVCRTLLCNPITEDYSIHSFKEFCESMSKEKTGVWYVSVVYNPGVMDPVEASILKALSDMGMKRDVSARTGSKYAIYGDLSDKEIEFISRKLLFNPLIQHPLKDGERLTLKPREYRFKASEVKLASLDADELSLLSRNQQLFLSREEMLLIQKYYEQ